MIPAAWMRGWFVVWLWVLLGGFGYLRHMLMGSFLPVINYMIFIPLNLTLLSKHHYYWLIASMFASLMFHGSSGVIIQTGTFLCMATRFKVRDWMAVAPLAVAAVGIYIWNHEQSHSIAATILLGMANGNFAEDGRYANYLAVIRQNGLLGRYDWANYLAVNWYFYYLGLPLLAALVIIGVAWAKKPETRQWTNWLARFTVLPLGVIAGWWMLADLRPYTFDMMDRAANALSIVIFIAAGLACSAMLPGADVPLHHSLDVGRGGHAHRCC